MAPRRPVRPGKGLGDYASAAAKILQEINSPQGSTRDVLESERHDDARRAQMGLPPLDRFIPAGEVDDPQDTGWIPVGSTRVREIRYLPNSERLFVRFHKYDTAYVYRGVTTPPFTQAATYGQGGSGLGGYINDVLNNFNRDYCSPLELDKYFGGYGGSYRGPGR